MRIHIYHVPHNKDKHRYIVQLVFHIQKQFRKLSEEDNNLSMIKYYKWFDQTSMKKRFNVLVTRRLHRSALDELEKKNAMFSYTLERFQFQKKNLMNKIKNMNGLICHPYDTIDKEIINNAENLQVISTFSVGFDHIDIEVAKTQGIKIGYTPEVLTNATAELAIGLILDVLRRISEGDRIIRNKKWKQIFGAYDYTGIEVSGKNYRDYGNGKNW